MSPTNIHGADYRIGKVFSNDFVFKMPPYQRPYAWTTEQAGELLDGLLLFIDEEKQVDELNPYFLGSVVLIKGDSSEAEVVDGQQRLTTLTILLAVLRELTSQNFADGLTQYLYEKGNLVEGTPNRYRLTLREQDATFFQKYIQDAGGLKDLQELWSLPFDTLDSQKNLYNNCLHFLKRLRGVSEEKRERLAQFIAKRCYLVIVSTPDFESAYRIFMVLNDRGLPLTYADILKADVLGNIPDSSVREEYARKWESAEEQLGREPFQSLFSHIRMIFRKTKARNVLAEFREHVRPGDKPKAFVDSLLLPMSDAFSHIRKASYEGKHQVQINRMLTFLGRIDNADWIPPAILYMKQNQADPDKLLRFLTDLERLASGLMVRRTYVNHRIERYGRVLTAIEENADLYASGSPLQLTASECTEVIDALESDVYNSVPARPILLRLDAALSDGSASYEHATVTVEHVLPQNPSGEGEWIKLFPKEEERAHLTHKIGNLVLLSRRKNARAGNYDFDRKKRNYFAGSDGTSAFVLTSQVLQHNTWTPKIISRRQEELVTKLRQVWRL